MIIENGRFLCWRNPCVQTSNAFQEEAAIFGYGVSNYLSAAIIAFSHGINTGFVRSAAKTHGLGLVIEGSLSPTASSNYLLDMNRELSPTVLKEFKLINCKREITKGGALLERISVKERDVCLVSRVIKQYKGTFELSSGTLAKTYVDTVPATTGYNECKIVAEVAMQLLGDFKVIIAPPYGGIGLGVMLALMSGAELRIPLLANPEDRTAKLNLEFDDLKGAAFVDDYFSTGSTLKRVFQNIPSDLKIFSVCSTMASGGFVNKQLYSMFYNDNGNIEPSDMFCQLLRK